MNKKKKTLPWGLNPIHFVSWAQSRCPASPLWAACRFCFEKPLQVWNLTWLISWRGLPVWLLKTTLLTSTLAFCLHLLAHMLRSKLVSFYRKEVKSEAFGGNPFERNGTWDNPFEPELIETPCGGERGEREGWRVMMIFL